MARQSRGIWIVGGLLLFVAATGAAYRLAALMTVMALYAHRPIARGQSSYGSAAHIRQRFQSTCR